MVSTRLAPKFWAAQFKVVWNAWCTASRFQQDSPCLFCDSAIGTDSLVHIAHCRTIRETVKRLAAQTEYHPSHFFGCFDKRAQDDYKLLMAVMVYCTYQQHNFLRNSDALSKEFKLGNPVTSMCRIIKMQVFALKDSKSKTGIIHFLSRGRAETT